MGPEHPEARPPSAAGTVSDGGPAEADGAEGDRPAVEETEVAETPDAASADLSRGRSRRFPVFTRGTARPEGGGRVAGGDAPAPYRQWPLLVVCGGALIGLLVTMGEFRSGTMIIGASLLAGAVLRRLLPSVGMLAVRSRFTDLLTYGVLGIGIILLAMMAQPDPWIDVPILEDILHFSVQ